MIPDKLYIPTSTLNFNNIMSSESISPAGFYSQRMFGYKRFEKVGPNNLDNRIVLYKKYPLFDIIDPGLENYPLTIEVETNYQNEGVLQERDGIFYADETLYLNPFTTKFFFRNKSEQLSTISKAEPSIEAKLVELYRTTFLIEQDDMVKFKWQESVIKDSGEINFTAISKDRRVNKLKGLLYSYLIGANKSVPQTIALLKQYQKQLGNLLSAMISSPDGQPTYQQKKQLGSLYDKISFELNRTLLDPEIKKKSDQYKCDFYEILIQEQLLNSWIRQNNMSLRQIKPFITHSKERDAALTNYMEYVSNEIMDIATNSFESRCEAKDLPILQNNRVLDIPGQKPFLVKLLNEFLNEAYSSQEFLQSRLDFATAGGKLFREELGDKWEDSPSRKYINSLLENLNEHKSFDLKSTNNKTLESFAAFCQKGEDSIERLEEHLISNAIGDYRISFGLWGVIFGFANMPKTYTNEFFASQEVDYVHDVYRYIFHQLHGIELPKRARKVSSKGLSHENVGADKNTNTSPKPETEFTAPIDENNIITRLKEQKIRHNLIELILDQYRSNQCIVNDHFYKQTEKISGVGKVIAKRIKSALKPFEQSSEERRAVELPLAFNQVDKSIGKEFYNDPNTWQHIDPLIPANKKSEVRKEIDWIQEVHQQNGYKKKSGDFVSLLDHSNQNVITHFENNVKNRIEQKLLLKIVKKLRELYSDNA